MAKRILMVMTRASSAHGASTASGAAELARESGGKVRMMYVSPIPAPRVDKHDRVVADADQEMERITGQVERDLAALTAELDDVPIEGVVRFGRLRRELSTEVEAFQADLVVLASPPQPGLGDHLRAWYLERAVLGSKVPVVLLQIGRDAGEDPSREALALASLRQI